MSERPPKPAEPEIVFVGPDEEEAAESDTWTPEMLAKSVAIIRDAASRIRREKQRTGNEAAYEDVLDRAIQDIYGMVGEGSYEKIHAIKTWYSVTASTLADGKTMSSTGRELMKPAEVNRIAKKICEMLP